MMPTSMEQILLGFYRRRFFLPIIPKARADPKMSPEEEFEPGADVTREWL
jgi:hypothetical protein